MSLFARAPRPPVDAVLITAETAALIESEQARARAAREQELEQLQHQERIAALKRSTKSAAKTRLRDRRAALVAKARPVLPLLVVNAAAVYGQLDYAYREVAPETWNTPSKIALAIMFALAVESIALYVGWHAHDALMHKAHGSAARLRRASYVVAAAVAWINYTHFDDGSVFRPTSAAVAFGLLSLLSPWLWGLHTRRAQNVRLLAEDASRIDGEGAQFSVERWRAFPIRSWMARRWSIDHNEYDPKVAWAAYNAERLARRAMRRGDRAERKQRKVRTSVEARPAVRQSPPPIVAAPVCLAPGPVDEEAALGPAGQPAGIGLDTAVAVSAADKVAVTKSSARKRPPSSEDRVVAAHRRTPAASDEELAARLGLSLRTVQRWRPAKLSDNLADNESATVSINGKMPDLQGVTA